MFKNLKFKSAVLSVAILGGGLIANPAGQAFADVGHSGKTVAGEPGKASQVSRTVQFVMNDNYYEPESIAVKKGETVRFEIENKGVLVHEFNIGTAETHAAHKEEMLMMMQHGVLSPDKIHHDKMDGGDHSMKHDDPNSVLLESGESANIIWKFTDATELEFACNIPGHYESGMVGTLTVQ